GHGFGLFYHDCRYLNGYEIRIGGQKPEHLVWHAETGFMAVIAPTQPEFFDFSGNKNDPPRKRISWVPVIKRSPPPLQDVFAFQNLTLAPLDFKLSLRFLCSFEDLFEIRGLTPKHRGEIEPPRWVNNILELSYRGADAVHRNVLIQFSRKPAQTEGASASFDIQLK